jgi:hypothetical protein
MVSPCGWLNAKKGCDLVASLLVVCLPVLDVFPVLVGIAQVGVTGVGSGVLQKKVLVFGRNRQTRKLAHVPAGSHCKESITNPCGGAIQLL